MDRLQGSISSPIFTGSSLAAEKVGDFPASGFLFKDSVQTLAIDDPEVQGVTIYISGRQTDFLQSQNRQTSTDQDLLP